MDIKEQIKQLRNPVAYGPVGAQKDRDRAADTMGKLLAVADIAQEFCDRRDQGSVQSTYTYNKFKEALAAVKSTEQNDD